MKALVIDCRMISNSGIGRYISEILPYIIDKFKEEVVLLGKKEELQQYNTPILEFNAPIYSIQEQLKYSRIIPKSKLFWSPHFNIPLFPIRSEKRITTIHDAYHLAYYKYLSLSQKIYAKTVINAALKISDKIITVSNFSKKELLQYTHLIYKDKIEVIYNGISDKKSDENNKNVSVNPYPYILYVGNIKPHKNLENALEAYALFLKKHSEITNKPLFKIVGKRDGFINGSQDRLKKILDNNPVLNEFVVFTGFVSDIELNKLYSEALAFIFPSKYEGFGLPLLEAMRANCPVLASNIPPIREICGDSVLYFDPESINDISEKISLIYFSEDLRKELMNKGDRIYKKYLWEASAKKHLNIIMQLL